MKLRLLFCLLFIFATRLQADPQNPVYPPTAKSVDEIVQSFAKRGWSAPSSLRYQNRFYNDDVFFIWDNPFSGYAGNLLFAYAFDGTQWKLFYHDTLASAFLSVQAADFDESTGQLQILVRGDKGKVLTTLPVTSWHLRPQK